MIRLVLLTSFALASVPAFAQDHGSRSTGRAEARKDGDKLNVKLTGGTAGFVWQILQLSTRDEVGYENPGNLYFSLAPGGKAAAITGKVYDRSEGNSSRGALQGEPFHQGVVHMHSTMITGQAAEAIFKFLKDSGAASACNESAYNGDNISCGRPQEGPHTFQLICRFTAVDFDREIEMSPEWFYDQSSAGVMIPCR